MKPFTTKIYGTYKSALQVAQEWVNKNASGPVSVRYSPNTGGTCYTTYTKILTPSSDGVKA